MAWITTLVLVFIAGMLAEHQIGKRERSEMQRRHALEIEARRIAASRGGMLDTRA